MGSFLGGNRGLARAYYKATVKQWQARLAKVRVPRVLEEPAEEEDEHPEVPGPEKESLRGTATHAESGVTKLRIAGPSRVSNPTRRVKEEEIRRARVVRKEERKERRVRKERQGFWTRQASRALLVKQMTATWNGIAVME